MGNVASGSRIGRYVVLEELGVGGMGVVYRARDESEGRDVALKVLRQTSAEAVRRMRREARATDGLDPARIAQVYEIGETPDGALYLAMEYVPGRTLREILRRGGLDRKEALRVIGEIATALGEAHRAGVVHRDVKPENVMVRDDGRVVLLDFGIAKQFAASGDAAQATTQLTSEGTMIGTLAYLAPEQALGNEIGPAVDQFALAVTSFELLTGKLPWTGTEVGRMLVQLLSETPPPASTLNRTLPQPYDAVLGRALRKAPGDRFLTVEEFAVALAAAERGEILPSYASQTVDAPFPHDFAGANEGRTQGHPRKRWRLRPAFAALLAVGLVAGGALIRGRMRAAHETSHAVQTAPMLDVSNSSPLACPVFEVTGLPEFETRIGAAAGTLACGRAKWYLGGRDDHVLPPAALLHAPLQPTADLPDLYAAPQREHTLELIKQRGLPHLDGHVTWDRNSWRVDLFLRAPDGREIAHLEGIAAAELRRAIKEGVSQLWQRASLEPGGIDPEVALWTGLPDIQAGLIEADFDQGVDVKEACEAVERRASALGSAFYRLNEPCDGAFPDGGPLPLDESSPASLETTSDARLSSEIPIPHQEERRLAEKLEELAAREPRGLGRAYIAKTTGRLWNDLGEHDRAKTAFLSALVEDPLLFHAWEFLADPQSTSGWSESARSLASLWFPNEPAYLPHASSGPSDDLEARLHDTRLAYLLSPGLPRILRLGLAFAEAGQEDDARALTRVTPAGRSSPDPDGVSMLLAFIDLHDARFASALTRFESAGRWGMRELPIVAPVLGRGSLVSAAWATAMLKMSEQEAWPMVVFDASSAAVCMNAGPGLATRCLARVEKLCGTSYGWGPEGDAFVRGAKRYAVGDLHGAVDAWRPIVGDPDDRLVRLLPTEAFERVGEPGLAARIDARKLKYRYLAGISDATPREARRAFKQGDRARAREFAQKVIDAWEVADTAIPAVAEMRALLAKTSHP